MSENHTEKFNVIMPESNEFALCVKVNKPISEAGYEENFLPRIEKMVAAQGEIRLLVYFEKPQGWEKGAAEKDIEAFVEKGSLVKKLAIVNPPPKEIKNLKIRAPLLKGEMKFFNEEALDEAIKWVKS